MGTHVRFWPDGTTISQPNIGRDSAGNVIVGHGPVPINNDEVIFHCDEFTALGRGVYLHNRRNGAVHRLKQFEANELAGGGGNYGMHYVDARGHVVEWEDGRVETGAGQPYISRNGLHRVWSTGEFKYEPSVSNSGTAVWGDSRGRIYGQRSTGPVEDWTSPGAGFEAYPRIFETSKGDYLLTMIGNPSVGLRVRRIGPGVMFGYQTRTGNNRNLRPDVIAQGLIAKAVTDDGAGNELLWYFDLDALEQRLTDPNVADPEPPDPPDPPDPPEPPMPAPDHRHIVAQVAQTVEGADYLRRNTHETRGKFTEVCVEALRAVDPNWGHVDKDGGEAQYNDHAEDCVKYRTDGQVVDIILGRTDGVPTTWAWILQPLETNRPSNEWEPYRDPSNPIEEESLHDDDGGGPPPDPNPDPDPGDDERDDAQDEQIRLLKAQVAHLEAAMRDCIRRGDIVDLKSNEGDGPYVCADEDRSSGGNPNKPLLANRRSPGYWERYRINK